MLNIICRNYIRRCFFNNSILAPVNCEWGQWKLGECSKTCDSGVRNNTRSKIVNEAHNGKCEGNDTVQEACSMQNCSGKLTKKSLIPFRNIVVV